VSRALLAAWIAALAVSAAGASSALDDAVPFSSSAFREAQSSDRLVLLVLEAGWNAASRDAVGGPLSDPAVLEVIHEGYVVVRADAELRPDLVRRYPAAGWPALSVLLPDGTPLWIQQGPDGPARRITSGFRPADAMARWLRATLAYYRQARDVALRVTRERQAQLVETARPKGGRLDFDDVWATGRFARVSFDRDSRYFVGLPRIPYLDRIELFFRLSQLGEPTWDVFGETSLETLVRELTDGETGAIYRLAADEEWEEHPDELLTDRNARFLATLGVAYRATADVSFREAGVRVARFLIDELGRDDGGFGVAVWGEGASGRDMRAISESTALAATALIRAGAAFGAEELVERGVAGAEFLARERLREDGAVVRWADGDELVLPYHVGDLAAAAEAFLAAHEATGRSEWLERARRVLDAGLSRLVDPELGALRDVVPSAGGPRPLAIALFPIVENARFARALARAAEIAGETSYDARAEALLEGLADDMERLGNRAPAFSLAVSEWMHAPVVAKVNGAADTPRTRALRRAAMGGEWLWTVVVTGEEDGEPALRGSFRGETSRDETVPARVRATLARLVADALDDADEATEEEATEEEAPASEAESTNGEKEDEAS
jgi:uncharacterized protein YyaL (SSP411 family)